MVNINIITLNLKEPFYVSFRHKQTYEALGSRLFETKIIHRVAWKPTHAIRQT